MIIVPVKLPDYRISAGHLVLLAEDYYGKPLTNDEESGTIELGFEPIDGVSDTDLAAAFERALQSFKPNDHP